MNNGENRRKIYKERRFGDENNYRALYRFSRENVEWLAEYFLPDYYERRGGALNKIMQMQAFLRYVGDPGFQVSSKEHSACYSLLLATSCRVFQNFIIYKEYKVIIFIHYLEDYNYFK